MIDSNMTKMDFPFTTAPLIPPPAADDALPPL